MAMRRTKLLAVAVATVMLGFWGLAALTRPSASAAASAASAAAAPASSDPHELEIAELKQRLARIEASARTGASPESGPARAAAAPGKADGEARDPAVAQRELEIAAFMEDHYTPEVQANVFGSYFADIDRLRSAETPDLEWAGAVERGLSALLADAADTVGAAKVMRLECGSSLCRMKIDVANPKLRGRLVHAIQRNLKLDEASVHMPAEGTALEGYFARAGSSLPQFDQLKYVGSEMDRIGSTTP
jgi:hypothetical protein